MIDKTVGHFTTGSEVWAQTEPQKPLNPLKTSLEKHSYITLESERTSKIFSMVLLLLFGVEIGHRFGDNSCGEEVVGDKRSVQMSLMIGNSYCSMSYGFTNR